MPTKFNQVYQFKISLAGIKPVIWRRIQVPENYAFWDLHVAIQDAMGWLDCHLHQFVMHDKKLDERVLIGMPDNEWDGGISVKSGGETAIADYFSLQNKKAIYEYDFGDGWEHEVLLEKILPFEVIAYPVCLAGERACPPEDCGGIGGYENLIKIMKNPRNKEYKNMIEWLGGKFDPEYFHSEEVCFDNPKARWKESMC
jgi:hypothetical protein